MYLISAYFDEHVTKGLQRLIDNIAKETGNNFNIFEITHISQKEVPMCRILTELLDPNGSHGQNKIYLILFFK